MELEERFELARLRAQNALAAKNEMAKGIGTQMERTLHCVLKYYIEPDESRHEVRVGTFIADIYQAEQNRIIEIQTRNFSALRQKLSYFVQDHKVTVVYPIARQKWMSWVDPATGEMSGRRKSPRKGEPWDALPELYRLAQLVQSPNLSFYLLLLDMEEYRLLDGWSKDKKKGSHRMERIPLRIDEAMELRTSQDYGKLLPDFLPDPFTKKDFMKATRLSSQKSSFALTVLQRMAAIRQSGKEGRAFLYTREG